MCLQQNTGSKSHELKSDYLIVRMVNLHYAIIGSRKWIKWSMVVRIVSRPSIIWIDLSQKPCSGKGCSELFRSVCRACGLDTLNTSSSSIIVYFYSFIFYCPEYVTATTITVNCEQIVGQDSKATQDALITAHKNYATQKKHNILTNTSKLNKIHSVYLPNKTWKWWKVCVSRQTVPDVN